MYNNILRNIVKVGLLGALTYLLYVLILKFKHKKYINYLNNKYFYTSLFIISVICLIFVCLLAVYVSYFYIIPLELASLCKEEVASVIPLMKGSFTLGYNIVHVEYYLHIFSNIVIIILGYYRTRILIEKINWNNYIKVPMFIITSFLVRRVQLNMNKLILIIDPEKGYTLYNVFNMCNYMLAIIFFLVIGILITRIIIIVIDKYFYLQKDYFIVHK